MTATVSYEGTGCFLVLADDTRGWIQSTTQTANYQNALAEVIAGAPTSPSGSPEMLAPFGRVTFTVTHINEARPRSSPLTQVDLEDSPGDVVA